MKFDVENCEVINFGRKDMERNYKRKISKGGAGSAIIEDGRAG